MSQLPIWSLNEFLQRSHVATMHCTPSCHLPMYTYITSQGFCTLFVRCSTRYLLAVWCREIFNYRPTLRATSQAINPLPVRLTLRQMRLDHMNPLKIHCFYDQILSFHTNRVQTLYDVLHMCNMSWRLGDDYSLLKTCKCLTWISQILVQSINPYYEFHNQ